MPDWMRRPTGSFSGQAIRSSRVKDSPAWRLPEDDLPGCRGARRGLCRRTRTAGCRLAPGLLVDARSMKVKPLFSA